MSNNREEEDFLHYWQTWCTILRQSILNDSIRSQSKGLSRKKHVSSGILDMVVRDVLALVRGPRSAVLLNYLHGHGENTITGLREVINMMGKNIPPGNIENIHTGNVSIMVFDGCLLLIRVDRLEDRMMPRGISFTPNTNNRNHKVSILCPAWMTDGEQEALEASFQSIVRCLSSSGETDGLDLEHVLSDKGIALGVNGSPCPPTLYGWLLGYPVTYHVTSADHAAQVSRCLSCNTLVLYSLHTRPRGMDPGDTTLISFSIPQSLHGQMAENLVRTWGEDMIGECHQELWSSPELKVASKQGECIVL
jgi:hypothetical protein